MDSKKMSLMERIDFIRANSVTNAEFKAMWGYSIDEFSKKMMKCINRYDDLLEKNRPTSF